MLTFVGHDVRRENHIGDWGTPFGMLIEHLVDLGEEIGAHELSMGDLDAASTRQARASFDADPTFADRSRHRVVLLQSATRRRCDCGGSWWARASATSTPCTPSSGSS